jgi:hypothetical protein
MDLFMLRHVPLPHDGVIPGARGHKKIVVPKGTEVFCITPCVDRVRMFWCAYLKEDSAQKTLEGLTKTVVGPARRQISYENLVAWNFKYEIPKRIHREK